MTTKKDTESNAIDLRPEQIPLLRLEKQIAGIAATGATLGLTGAAARASDKLEAMPVPPEQIGEWHASLLDFLAKTTDIHSAFETMANEKGAELLAVANDYLASGGDGKNDPPARVIASILGLS